MKPCAAVQRQDEGRPEVVYGRIGKHDQLEHDLRITDFANRYPEARLERGVAVGDTEPDAVLDLGGRTCFLEIDHSGKMDRRQMEAKWRRYGRVEGFILVVCDGEPRLQRLRQWSEAVKDCALFTTFERLASRTSEPWIDWYGNTTDL